MAGERVPELKMKCVMGENEFLVPVEPAYLRMILVGKTGAGKSSSGNTILGRDAFQSRSSPNSVTKECWIEEGLFKDNHMSITDTPGVYDTEFTEKELNKQIDSSIYMTSPGPHIFLLVINVGIRHSREERGAVEWIREKFGEEALRYTIVLFSHVDSLRDTSLTQYINESTELKMLISQCGGRYHGFNNLNTDRAQVNDLLKKVEETVKFNREMWREYYSNKLFEEAQKQISKARDWKDVAVRAATAVGTVAMLGGALFAMRGKGLERLVLPALTSLISLK